MRYNIKERLEKIRVQVMKEKGRNLNSIAGLVKRKLDELANKYYRAHGKEAGDNLSDVKMYKVRIEQGKVLVYTDSVAYKLFYDPELSEYPPMFRKYNDEFNRWCKKQGLFCDLYGQGILEITDDD